MKAPIREPRPRYSDEMIAKERKETTIFLWTFATVNIAFYVGLFIFAILKHA